MNTWWKYWLVMDLFLHIWVINYNKSCLSVLYAALIGWLWIVLTCVWGTSVDKVTHFNRHVHLNVLQWSGEELLAGTLTSTVCLVLVATSAPLSDRRHPPCPDIISRVTLSSTWCSTFHHNLGGNIRNVTVAEYQLDMHCDDVLYQTGMISVQIINMTNEVIWNVLLQSMDLI